MKQTPRTRIASSLLMAASALPFTPLLAQETAPATTPSAAPPVVEAPPPVTTPAPAAPAAVAPVPAPTMEPVEHSAPAAEAPEAAPTARRTVTRTPRAAPTRTVQTTRIATTPAAAAPINDTTTTATPAPVVEPPITPAPFDVAPTAAPPVPGPAAVTPPPVVPDQQYRTTNILPWIIGAVLVLGALALLIARRRRRAASELYYERSYDEPATLTPEQLATAPLGYEASAPVVEPAAESARMSDLVTSSDSSTVESDVDVPAGMALGMAATPAIAETETAPADSAPSAAPIGSEAGEPDLDLSVRPVRAGVGEENARVEFELTVDNKGSAPAHDVRISTWMFPAGSNRGSEMEYMLIGERGETKLNEVDAGDARSIESAVAMPTHNLGEDSLLPIVVAEARYRRADGTEERTSARFAVGVPIDNDLAHFDLEHPSGLHEGVEARPIDELERT